MYDIDNIYQSSYSVNALCLFMLSIYDIYDIDKIY